MFDRVLVDIAKSCQIRFFMRDARVPIVLSDLPAGSFVLAIELNGRDGVDLLNQFCQSCWIIRRLGNKVIVIM